MVLVTGCNGLIGKKLIDRLLGDGEPVRGLDFWRDRNLAAGVEFFEGTVLDDELLLDATADVDTVYHLMDIYNTTHNSRRRMRRINTTGTEKLLAAARDNHVRKVVFLSSGEVYGMSDDMPIGIGDPLHPVTRYGKDKVKAEKICQAAIENDGMDITIFRPTIMAGPGIDDPLILIILYMAMAMGDGNRFYVGGDGSSRFQLVHPDDVVDALIRAKDRTGSRGGVYNLGSDNVPTQIEQVERIKKTARVDGAIHVLSPAITRLLSIVLRPFNINYLSKEHVIFILSNFVLDCSTTKTDLGWSPTRDNVAMMAEAVEWYRKEKL